MRVNKKGDVYTGDLYIVQLSKYSQDYKEDWGLFPVQKPFTILRKIEDKTFENLEGTEIYKMASFEEFEINKTYISSFHPSLFVIPVLFAPLSKLKKLRDELEKIEIEADLDYEQIRKIKF